MSENLIKRSDVIAIIEKRKARIVCNSESDKWFRKMISDIGKKPSIDIVRCGECKYQRDDLCDKWSYSHCVKPNDFCSYGVKKGADDE